LKLKTKLATETRIGDERKKKSEAGLIIPVDHRVAINSKPANFEWTIVCKIRVIFTDYGVGPLDLATNLRLYRDPTRRGYTIGDAGDASLPTGLTKKLCVP
jgi:hypothetical protein